MKFLITVLILFTSALGIADADGLWSCNRLKSDGYGFTWTLTTRLGDALSDAETLFGARDKSWTILGCQYCKGDMQPENWYPGYPKRKDIVINLSAKANEDVDIALFQLSHEVVHTLSPKVGVEANVLEEGVAVWFSVRYVKKATGKDATKWLSKNYRYAYDAVKELMRNDIEAVKKLRKIQPCFKLMTEEAFRKAGVDVSPNDLQVLLRKWPDALKMLDGADKVQKRR